MVLNLILCRNLLSLKYYDGDVEDLSLNFVMATEELGQSKVRGGRGKEGGIGREEGGIGRKEVQGGRWTGREVDREGGIGRGKGGRDREGDREGGIGRGTGREG